MYSKKIMQRFLKPKYAGKIANPDGVGTAGNPQCLLPEEKIHTNPSMIKISELNNGKVLNHEGEYSEVLNSFNREYSGKIIRLKNKLGTISITPEHLVYAIKLPKHEKYFRTKNKKKLIPSWYHAEDLEKGDIALYPIIKKEKNLDFIGKDIAEKSWFDKNYLYTPITEVEKKDYSGKVHNLEVENTHSFVSEAFTLHNCGDVMEVYLKIDKSGVIKKVRFNTFGCGMAIAASDALCEMAEGKSLEEAEKITSQDIVKHLGGEVPPIKIHCSVLGMETLRNAIKNYKEKKNERKNK